MRIDDRVAKTWFRVPYWFTPTACASTFNLTVVNSAGQTWLFQANLTELTEITQFALFRAVMRGYAASPVGVQTGYDNYIKPMLLVSIVEAMSRLYYYPVASVNATAQADPAQKRVTGGSDYAGVPTEVRDFTLSALHLDNPWNAISAGIAWGAAPWSAYPSNFITYERDDDLIVLPNRRLF
jgi:hypothetical protein